MGCPPVNAVFDTNIVIDALNGVSAADVEYRRYERVLISRITWKWWLARRMTIPRCGACSKRTVCICRRASVSCYG